MADGSADTTDTTPPEYAAEPDSASCEHSWAYICGYGLSVRQCLFCCLIDWEAQKRDAGKIREAAVRNVLADLRHLCRHVELLDVERLWAELGRVVREKYGISLEPAPAAVPAENGLD